MAVLEPLSKQVIRNAYLNSYRGKPGQEKFEPDLFITHFGRFVLGQFSGIRLIGEIEYKEGKETHEVFRDCLREVLVEKNLWHICQSGTKSWRAILSFYFVSTAIFSYGEETGNELWPHVMRGLGLEKDGNLSQQCGELFLKCLKENKLERFGSLKCGHPFTTRILLHGLIPTRHIDRFVSELIQPELHNHVGIYSTGAYLIQKWQQSGNFRYLPKPIQRFIEHGSFASVHVADRFLEMAKRWNEDDPTLARQWGLPEYMVDAFRRNIQNGNDARSRKPWVGTSRGRPYLFFDLEKSEAPILCIPSQQFKSAVVFQLKWSDLHGGSHIANIPVHFTSIDGNFYSDPQDLEVKPNVEGWELEIVDQSSGSIFPQFIPVSLPAGSNEERIPLLFFNRDTGKLFYPENGRSLPSELLLVFRKGCSLEVQGCTLSGEPERLTGFWRDWQYILCTLQGEDASLIFKFHSESTATLSKTIRLSSGDTGDKLEFGEDGQAPSWIRCLEKWPVFVDAKKICIRCDEFGSRIWGRAYGKIIRRDQDGYAAALDLNFHQKENAWESCLPFPDHWEPGVYEIQLRGPLGIEDAILPFVYIPQEVCRRAIDPETGIAIEFQLGRLSGLGIELLPHTAIVEDESKCIITPHHEQGIAFCGFKLFHPSRQSITLLLARNELRWSMRSEQGLFRWDHWRCVPEEIPLQRLDELADARVAIQYDGGLNGSQTNRGSAKLHLLLETMNDKKDDERILLSYSAPKLQRYIHDTWIVDLSKFSDHIKSLGVVEAAVIKVQTADQRDNLTLITFRKYPAFKDFQVEAQSGNGTGDKEKLLVSWIPQRNDPVTQRTLYIFPAEKPELSEKHRLTDGSLPPFEIQMEPPQKPALWCASMETNQSRFHTVTATFCPRVSFQWFRAPDDWVDWLDWHDSTAEAIQARVGSLKNLKQDFKEKVIPWSYFLLHFHFDKGKDCLNVIRSILGDSALEYLLPYSRGQIWDIRTALTTRVSVEIASSTIEARAWEDHLTYRYPYYWHKIPEEVDMELSLCSDHKYLGPAGALWKFKKAATNKIANLVSEEGSPLDLPIWLEDALEPDREGSLVARCPLRAIWNYPIHLPILKNIQQENRSWSEIEKKERPPLPPKIQPTSIHRSFAALRELLHCQNKGKPSNTYRETVHPQISQNSKDFAKQWMNWAETVNQNRFLSLLILGRLQAMGPIGLSGPVALISRFRSRGIWIEQISKMHTAYEQSIDNLYKSSLQFVIKNTPKAFLKDLILSEIIISWYWDQNLAKI